MFTSLIDTPARTRLATFFLIASPRTFHAEEARKAVKDSGAVVLANLKHLAKNGLLKPVERKGELYYRINSRYPYIDELRDLLLKKPLRFRDPVFSELQRLNRVVLVVLSGLFTGEPHMPTDLVIVGSPSVPVFKRVINSVEKEIRQPVNYTIFSEDEFLDRINMHERFTRDLFDNAHIIVLDKRTKPAKASPKVNKDKKRK